MNELKEQKIAYLISQYPAISHTFFLREVTRLREKGFDIHVASINETDRPLDQLTEQEREEQNRTYYIKKGGILQALKDLGTTLFTRPLGFFRGLFYTLYLGGTDLKRLLWNMFYFTEAVMVGSWMNSHSINHLHVYFANPASSVGLIMSKTFPHTFSISIHGPDIFENVQLNYLSEKIKGATFICCIGKYARSQLMRHCPVGQWDKFEIAPLGIDPDIYTPKPFVENPAPFSLLCVGRLVPAKGQHILIAAMELLVKEGHPVKLQLVGDGPDRITLERDVKKWQLTEYVTFSGALNQEDTLEAFREADLFILPSFAEGTPVVLMEAMAMEIPCIATYITGIPELIEDNKEGLLVPPSDAEELAKAVAHLIKKTDVRKQMGIWGRERILQDYHLEKNINHLGHIYSRRLPKNYPKKSS